ncbi:hypothetical protein B0H19DRAFT_380843 [Mycena capillaripes]|nr:hypothetical protein B0H19DRAFT_1199125 [Mycena capillaripes]KAJ6532665.1 hypothetical protein B0H19DRAFT_1383993 [Mycena capillaripes]KAJ6537007.1 hypothetical protein B0H19DRAFT_380843 [Mycena capillaripes]
MASPVPDDTPETDSAVGVLLWKLRTDLPAFPGFKYGLLYGTHCRGRRMVPVPVDYGFQSDIRLATVNDLYTECWVPSTLPPHLGNSNVGRLRVNNFPLGSTVPLEFPYTVFYVPQNVLPAQTNLNTCPPIVHAGVDWYGNVLVIRHGKRNPVIGMEKWDARLVDVMLQNLISTGALV